MSTINYVRAITVPKSAPATAFRNNELRNFGDVRRALPQAVLDAIADEQISRGYSLRKNPICGTCREQRSISGSCNCD